MSLYCKARPLFLVALLSTLSGIVPQNADAQVSEPDLKGGLDSDSGSRAPASAQWDIFLKRCPIRESAGGLGKHFSLERSFDADAPGFGPNNRDGSEDFSFQLVSRGECADQTDDLATQVLAPLPAAPSQDLHELLVDSSSSGATVAAPPLPNQLNSSDQGWHVSISPYLWLPGLHGTIGALGQDASVHASFGDIFSNFSFGLMGALDPRYKRFVMPLDFMWIKLSNDKATPFGILATSVKIKVNLDLLTQKIGYRIIDVGKFKVDALAGFRYWHVGNTLNVQSSPNNTKFYGSADWLDAVGGARIQAILSPKVALTIAGDAGGGGANSDYQVVGLIGWKLKRVILHAGWRYLSVNYRPSGGTLFDVTISGLVLGATIPLK